MGVCIQLCPLFVTTLVAMGIAVVHYSLFAPREYPLTLDIDRAQVKECLEKFTAVWEEIDRTKRCVFDTGLQDGEFLPSDHIATGMCDEHTTTVGKAFSSIYYKSHYINITVDDTLDFVFGIYNGVLRFEACLELWISRTNAADKERRRQCVNGLFERVQKINSNVTQCLSVPTTGEKLVAPLRFVGLLSQLMFAKFLLLTMLPFLRLSARTGKVIVILLTVTGLLLITYLHFMCKKEFVGYLFRVIASTKVLSSGSFKRIHTVDLDEYIGRNHGEWKPISSRNKTTWRYIGEDVVLHCRFVVSFNTTELKQEDIKVDWFHNRRRLDFTPRHVVLSHNITILNNSVVTTMTIVVTHMTAEDFGSYSCDINQYHHPFLIFYLDLSFPTEVHQVLSREIHKSIPPGSMLTVKYSHFFFPIHPKSTNRPEFYRRINNRTVQWTLSQPVTCSLLTKLQHRKYKEIHSNQYLFTTHEFIGAVKSFCVSYEDFGRHDFVVKRFGSTGTALETHAHPVSLIVKSTGTDNQSYPVDKNDFDVALTIIIDVLLCIPWVLTEDVFSCGFTFLFLIVSRMILRKLFPVVALGFLKQECRRQKIYIACSPRDRVWTNRNVVEFLESLGHETLLPARDCPPNQLEIEALAEGVVTCHKYVMVVSTHFLGEEQWRFERSLIVEELRRRQCCPDGEHPTCLLFVCLGAAEVPGPRVGGSVVHAPQARRRGGLRCQIRSWLEDAVFREEEWKTRNLLGASVVITISQSSTFLMTILYNVLQECFAIVMKRYSPVS